MSAADRDSVVGVGPSCAVPMPRSATRPAQYGWFTTWSTTTWGAPARVAVVVVPAPPWCTTAASRPNSACWLTSPTAKQRRPAEWHHRHADTGQPLREVLVRWRAHPRLRADPRDAATRRVRRHRRPMSWVDCRGRVDPTRCYKSRGHGPIRRPDRRLMLIRSPTVRMILDIVGWWRP